MMLLNSPQADEDKKDDRSWFAKMLDGGRAFADSKVGSTLLGAGITKLLDNQGMLDPDIRPVGYQGGIPKYTAVRQGVPMGGGTGIAGLAGTAESPMAAPVTQTYAYDPNRRPGSSGQRYFSDIQYAKAPGIAAANQQAITQAEELRKFNLANPARQSRPPPVATMRHGGIVALAQGRYLNGNSDGMADAVPATINNNQPAALSDGEFVVPADVVSHLGNGNSNAGAKTLDEMMARVRQQRTGRSTQGKQINPRKALPA